MVQKIFAFDGKYILVSSSLLVKVESILQLAGGSILAIISSEMIVLASKNGDVFERQAKYTVTTFRKVYLLSIPSSG